MSPSHCRLREQNVLKHQKNKPQHRPLRPLPLAQRLQAEARSMKHRMCHIPKNPYCDTCRRSRMYRRRITRKRREPLEARGNWKKSQSSDKGWQQTSSLSVSRAKVIKNLLCWFLEMSILDTLAAYPCTKRSSNTIVKFMLSFLGPSYHAHPTIMCKSDNAPEFMSACTTLGFVHEPSLSRRWPHNSVIEREIRTLEEVARAAHLGAGFHLLTDLWQHSVQYAAIVINAYHPVKDNEGNPHNRHMLASGKEGNCCWVSLSLSAKIPSIVTSLMQMPFRPCSLVGDMIVDRSHTKAFI